MADLIGWRESTTEALTSGEPRDSLALRIDASRRIMLRFELSLPGEPEMQALRYARRAMIREERLRGLEWDEPSMEDPTLSGTEIRWFALVSQAAWCRQKLVELVDRANRAAAEVRAERMRYPR